MKKNKPNRHQREWDRLITEGVPYRYMLGLEDQYIIFETGQVWNIAEKRFKSIRTDKHGYKFYLFKLDDEYYFYRTVHKLVAENFITKDWIKEGYIVHHKDHNQANNSIDNLQIMTEEEHIAYHSSSELTKQKRSNTRTKKKVMKIDR